MTEGGRHSTPSSNFSPVGEKDFPHHRFLRRPPEADSSEWIFGFSFFCDILLLNILDHLFYYKFGKFILGNYPGL